MCWATETLTKYRVCFGRPPKASTMQRLILRRYFVYLNESTDLIQKIIKTGKFGMQVRDRSLFIQIVHVTTQSSIQYRSQLTSLVSSDKSWEPACLWCMVRRWIGSPLTLMVVSRLLYFFFLPSYAFHLPFFTFGASNKDVFMHDQCKNGPMLQTISS